jgi:transcriptional regulator with XRE-family HTH domain
MSEALEFPAQDTFAQVVASNIRAEVARRGIEQQQLARALGMSQAAVSDRFRGKTAWTLNDVEAVAHVLRATTSDLLVRHQGLEPRTRWFGFDGRLTRLFAWRARRGERTASAEVVSLSAYRAAAAVSA